uniref:Cellulose synthase-like protein E1 n=1 Tax=Rhizophora mucronata TaxID=61149 RepID=A0A2P2MX92_RHIMU
MATFFTTSRKQYKLRNASVAKMVNIGEAAPNSMISLWYRCATSSSATLVVISNSDTVNPSDSSMVSMKAKR